MANNRQKFLTMALETYSKKGDDAFEKGMYKDAIKHYQTAKDTLKELAELGHSSDEITIKSFELDKKIAESKKRDLEKSKRGASQPNDRSTSPKTPSNNLPDNKNSISNPKVTNEGVDDGDDYDDDYGEEQSDGEGYEIPDDIKPFVKIYYPKDLKFGFEGVVGLKEVKEAVRNYVINPRIYKEEYAKYDLLDGACILLEGPPGTGKTTFAKALGKELGQPLISLKVSGIVNCYIGETAKNVDKLFDFVRKFAKDNRTDVTVFIDEIDEIAKSRTLNDKTSDAAVPALLRNLGSNDENVGLLIIANTNHKELLDKALVDRFRRKFYIPLPDEEVREYLFKQKTRRVSKDILSKIDFKRIVKESEGMNGRQIEYVCDDFQRLLARSHHDKFEIADYTEAIISLINNQRGR